MALAVLMAESSGAIVVNFARGSYRALCRPSWAFSSSAWAVSAAADGRRCVRVQGARGGAAGHCGLTLPEPATTAGEPPDARSRAYTQAGLTSPRCAPGTCEMMTSRDST